MTWSSLQLRNLAFVGPKKVAATLEFRTGINVICGASDTGKSFIVEAVDFLLGGSEPPRDIPERVGYDRARLSIKAAGEEIFTFERSMAGGDYKIYDGIVSANEPNNEGSKLRCRHAHGRDDNISGWLLSRMGLFENRIRKNKKGETQSLSFRDMARLVIVQENEIIKRGSPFLTGQYTTPTSEYSALKLLLTGVDDRALVASTESISGSGNATAKIELIDQWLADLHSEIADKGVERHDVEDQLKRLEQSIGAEKQRLERMQVKTDGAMVSRRNLFSELERDKGRADEIQELLDRFGLLKEHYDVDLARLSAIQESGSLFVHQEKVSCPLCGALPEHQHFGEACEGDIEIVVQAAKAEIEKIKKLSSELDQTVADLRAEWGKLSEQLTKNGERYR